MTQSLAFCSKLSSPNLITRYSILKMIFNTLNSPFPNFRMAQKISLSLILVLAILVVPWELLVDSPGQAVIVNETMVDLA